MSVDRVEPPYVECRGRTFKPEFAVVSFLIPDKSVLEEREIHDMNKFLVDSVNKRISDSAVHMATDLLTRYRNSFDAVLEKYKNSTDTLYQELYTHLRDIRDEISPDPDQFSQGCAHTYTYDPDDLLDEYKYYRSANYDNLQSQFRDTHNNKASTIGFNVAGAFDKLDDANNHTRTCYKQFPQYTWLTLATGSWGAINVETRQALIPTETGCPELDELKSSYQKNMIERKDAQSTRVNQAKSQSAEVSHEVLKANIRAKIEQQRNARTNRL